jgi:hypothetical protein
MQNSETVPEPQAKGINFKSFLGSVRRVLGPAIIPQLMKNLPPEVAEKVQRDAYIVGGWYPLSEFRLLHVAAQKASGRGIELSREIARDAAHDDFRGIYKVLTFVLTPEFLIKRTPSIWSRYYDTGKVNMEARSKFAHAQFTECTGWDRVLWQDVIGGCQGVLEVCGAREVKMSVVSGGGDEDHLSLTAEWA